MMPSPVTQHISLKEAERFLTALDESTELFTFQTFDDNKSRKDKNLAVIFNLSLDACKDRLQKLNQNGAGVFVTINDTDGKGRKIENFTRVRAVWHEDDFGTNREFPLEPHLLIESSPGKFHRYWMVDGLTPDDFKGVMETMVHVYGSDPNVKDIVRVLRVPGFYHQKDPSKPWMVKIINQNETLPYTRDQLISAFPPTAPKQTRSVPGTQSAPIALDGQKVLAAQFAAMAARHTHDNPNSGRHSQILWLGRECGQRGVSVDLAEFTLKQFESLMRPTDTTGKVAPMHWDSSMKAFLDAHAKGANDPQEKRYQPKPFVQRKPAQVTDIQDENHARIEYEKRIREADGDPGELLYVITPEILSSQLRESTQSLLLKLISESTRVPVSALKADGPKTSKKPDDDGDGNGNESPKQFMGELNERHAVVPVGGRILILNREFDPELRRPLLTFSSRSDFVTRYENRVITARGEEVDIGTYWLKSKYRKQVEGLVFMPGGDLPGYYNLWTGWGIEPRPGNCDRFIDFIGEVICGGDTTLYAYVWSWLAHLFQKPRELPGTALVLRGGQGIGKNRFVEAIGRLVGGHFIQLNSINQVAGRFSGHLADALLVFANEAIWGGDKSAEGALKAMITDPYSPIESKGKDLKTCANYKRIIAASNEDWIVPRGKGDRRYVVMDVSDRYKENQAYFGALHQELRAGGYRALMHELMTSPIDGFRPQNIPAEIRVNGWDLSLRSGSSIDRWWYDILQRGYLYQESGSYQKYDDDSDSAYLWPDILFAEIVQSQYLKWCERHRMAHPESFETLGAYLSRFGLKKTRPRQDTKRTYAYRFPDLDSARSIYGKIFGIPPGHWEDVDE